MKKILVGLLVSIAGYSTGFAQLDLKQIMTGNEFVGNSPESYYWSLDGQSIYFYWNPENKLASNLYHYSLKNQLPHALNEEEAQSVVFYDPRQRDFQRQFMCDEGVLWSVDKQTGKRMVHLNTRSEVYHLQRTVNPNVVVFNQFDQAFSLDISSGSIHQLTNFKAGERTSTIIDSNFLQKQQLELFEYVQDRNERSEFAKKQALNTKFKFPKEQYIGATEWSEIQVDPTVQYAIIRLTERTVGKPTNVEQFITNDGFTKHQLARDKVSSTEPNQRMLLYQMEKDTLIQLDFSALSDIRLKPAYLRVKDSVSHFPKDRSLFLHEVKFSQSNQLALCDVRSADNKDRWITLINLVSGTVKELEHQHDDAWIGGPGISSWNEEEANLEWIVDGESFYFQSEETGYSTLYRYTISTQSKMELFHWNKTEVYQVQLSKDKKSLFLEYNQCDVGFTGNHGFGRLDITAQKFVPYANLTKGYNEVLISPDESRLLIRHSTANHPWELYVMDNQTSASKLTQITHSTTKAFDAYPWIDPQVISFKASDGVNVFARIYEPEASKKNGAAVLFVHGAGYLQNAHHYWSNYYREYMFHHLLRDKGYTVLDVDYRASEGYGRDYRTAIYRHMGGRDLEDFIDAKSMLVKQYGIDANRIGIYGGSYGGFITLMGLLTKPNEFACGAALRSVTDWAHYNHEYTSNILNYPETDPDAYRKSSPIYFAENLQDPLVMLHGMVDDNVQFQDVVRLSQRFIELGKKDWELAVYPVESHGFKEAYSWYDEYRRILELMEKNLK
ncbi:MAG: prolyl oligopeptidase family serine peptidase [Crocinitomicaceae bacterium]